VVNDSKVTDFIPIEASKDLVILKAEKAKSYFIVPYNEFQFTVETTLTKRKVKASYVDGKINFAVTLAFKAKTMYGAPWAPFNLYDFIRSFINNSTMDPKRPQNIAIKCGFNDVNFIRKFKEEAVQTISIINDGDILASKPL
jgi:Spore germination B3/ GerAC like, C-terminal.